MRKRYAFGVMMESWGKIAAMIVSAFRWGLPACNRFAPVVSKVHELHMGQSLSVCEKIWAKTSTLGRGGLFSCTRLDDCCPSLVLSGVEMD
jgi:hypothetical protein